MYFTNMPAHVVKALDWSAAYGTRDRLVVVPVQAPLNPAREEMSFVAVRPRAAVRQELVWKVVSLMLADVFSQPMLSQRRAARRYSPKT